MTIEEAIVSVLEADATLTALVGTRIYPQEAPQDETLPLVLYATSDPSQAESMAGWVDLYDQAFRFDCYGGDSSGSYASAKAVAQAVRDRLHAFARGPVTVDGETVYVRGISDDGGEDGLEPPAHGEERGVDYCAVQVRVWWALEG